MQRLKGFKSTLAFTGKIQMPERYRFLFTTRYLVVSGLILVWLLVLVAATQFLPRQLAGWLAFLALLITPGYLLADVVTWRLNLDRIEQLALALPLGVVVLAGPGITTLLLHLTLFQLAVLWAFASGAMIILWLFHEHRIYQQRTCSGEPWSPGDLAILILLAVAFIALLPTFSLYKIDGDAYAVNSFTADALAGLPLNQSEPIFGTDIGPGVRMVFNQSLTINYLWSYLSTYGPNGLIAAASKSMLALWALFASYTLGKAAGGGRRRFGLVVASIQFLIYLAAPFFRGDNVSLFFFERINADKFMVAVTMLPVVFAFAIIFVRSSARQAWLAAALTTLAVSTIHPLIAAMLALGIGAFGMMHLLMNMRLAEAWKRMVFLTILAGIAMFLPLVQLVLSRGEAPLASSYPNSLEGWDIGYKQVPVLPFYPVQGLDVYGPAPALTDLKPGDVFESDNPFLIWRFIVNMDRRRLILFDLDHYISDPSLILEPPYLLALLLLPIFFWRLRRDLGAQFVVSVSLAVLFFMYNPILTPLIGSLVMPWILWRFVWLLPYALIFALAGREILGLSYRRLSPLLKRNDFVSEKRLQFAPLLAIILAAAILSPGIIRNVRNLNDRVAFSYAYPTPGAIFSRLNEETKSRAATVMADWDLSVTIPAFVANAHVVAHRAPTTSEIFPADRQDQALQRLIDQNTFYNTHYLTEESIAILERYNAGYVVAESGSELDAQFRLASQWFEWLADDDALSLYKVISRPLINGAINGNAALLQHDWQKAEANYRAALLANNGDLLALVGLANVAYKQGQFAQAEAMLDQALAWSDLPILHYQKGRLLLDQGRTEESHAEFYLAQTGGPNIPAFQVALGDACLSAGREACAQYQFAKAISLQEFPDESSALVAEADIWRQRGFPERSLALYRQAYGVRPSEYNAFVLVSIYRELGRFNDAEALVQILRGRYPLSADMVLLQADLAATQAEFDKAIDLYHRAILLNEIRVEDSTTARLALGQTLIEAERITEAAQEITYALELNPYNPAAYSLQGDLYHAVQDKEAAVAAYERALEIDPAQIGVFVALSDELRQSGGEPDDLMIHLQKALRENENEATLLLTLGDQWQRLGNTDRAIDAYQAALDQLGDYGQIPGSFALQNVTSRAFAYARIAATYEDQGEKDIALKYLQSAITAAPGTAWPHVLLGDSLRRYNEIDDAILAYKAAIAAEPAYIDAYVRLADLFEAGGETDQARLLYDRALELSGNAGKQLPADLILTALPDLSTLSGGASIPEAAFSSDETLVDSSPLLDSAAAGASTRSRFANTAGNGQITPLSGRSQEQEESDPAVRLYQQQLLHGQEAGWSPATLARLHKELGDIYLGRSDLSPAVAAFSAAVDNDAWWPEARLGLAETFSLQDRADEALEQLETAVYLAPGSVEAQIALADALFAEGRTIEAMTIYVTTAQRYPGNGRALLSLARAWRESERPQLATEAYRDAIATNPGSAYAYIGLAEIDMDAGNYEEAESLLNQAIALDQSNVTGFVRLAELEERRGNLIDALAWYQHAATLPTSNLNLNLALIDSLIRLGDHDTALTYIQEALQQRPKDSELLIRLGRTERALGRLDDALLSLSAAQANNPANDRIYIDLAELYLAMGQPDSALSAYGQAIDLNPEDPSYYISASQEWVVQGDLAVALDQLNAGLSQVPDPAPIYTAKARLLLRQGEVDAALETLRQGLRQLGENVPMLLAMGDYFANRANFEQVEERYNQALEVQPANADVHVALGNLHILRGQLDLAIAQYQEAIRIEPTATGHYLALGSAYELNDQAGDAENAYRQAILMAPVLASGYLNLAELYQGQERWEEAIATCEQGLAAIPASGQLLSHYARLKLAQGEQGQALQLLDEALLKEPTAATRLARGAIFVEIGLLTEAQVEFEAALAIEPASVEALIALGDLYKQLGDLERAEAYFVAAAEAAPGVPMGYLRMSTMAREREDREAVVYWNDLARQAEPGGLVRPTE